MGSENLRGVLIGAVSGLAGYYTYQETGLFSALIVIFTAGWIIYRFSSAENAWKTLGIALNPFMATIVFFLLGFSYSAITGKEVLISVALGIMSATAGLVFSLMAYKYWNIGS